MLSPNIINLAYLLASVLFIFGLKGMAHPRTAVRGNLMGAIGMIIAVVVTLFSGGLEFHYIIAGIIIGSLIGSFLAMRIKMTSIPEMVAIFNGFGGGASVLVAGAAMISAMAAFTAGKAEEPNLHMKIATALSGLIGSVTFFGSYVAFGKLAEFLAVKRKLYHWQKIVKWGFAITTVLLGVYIVWQDNFLLLSWTAFIFFLLTGLVLFSKNSLLPGQQIIKVLVAAITLAASVLVVLNPGNLMYYYILIGAAALLGVMLTLPIGGADMPVVIALLNSYSGLAACATGFVINNNVLIIAGSLVGASGLILTNIMCKAMNRSLTNVLFGVLGTTEVTPDSDKFYRKVKSTSADEIAMLLETAQRVVFVPGYGMAVSQAQHAVRDLGNLLELKYGTEVEYAVHPVAGRMPGHMNVLLAEADVPYDKLKELEEINGIISQVDVAIVVGANDVVNPMARTDPNSPIAGMPIIEVDRARTVIVIKRSLSPGFAGIPNPLFAMDNTSMFFNDGKKAFLEIIQAVKEL